MERGGQSRKRCGRPAPQGEAGRTGAVALAGPACAARQGSGDGAGCLGLVSAGRGAEAGPDPRARSAALELRGPSPATPRPPGERAARVLAGYPRTCRRPRAGARRGRSGRRTSPSATTSRSRQRGCRPRELGRLDAVVAGVSERAQADVDDAVDSDGVLVTVRRGNEPGRDAGRTVREGRRRPVADHSDRGARGLIPANGRGPHRRQVEKEVIPTRNVPVAISARSVGGSARRLRATMP